MKKILKPKNIYQKLKYARSGIIYTYRTEVGFKRIVRAFFIFATIALLLPIKDYFKIILVISLMFPISAEILNTAIEKTVDTATKEYQVTAKRAKDIASAFVYFSIFITFLIWCSVLYFAVT